MGRRESFETLHVYSGLELYLRGEKQNDGEKKATVRQICVSCFFCGSHQNRVFVMLSAGYAWEGWKLRHHKGYTPIKIASVTGEAQYA